MEFKDIIVLCFHRVSDEFSPAYPPIPVKVFDKICRFLSANYNIIHPHAVFEPRHTKTQALLVTFDDAYLDFYENALPILKKYKIPVIQHVITKCAESGQPFWTQRLNKVLDNYFINKEQLIFSPLNIDKKLKNKRDTEQTALSIYKYLLAKNDRETFLIELENNLSVRVKHTKMMTWSHLKEAMNHDIIIGSHTHSHNNLKELTSKEVTQELSTSKDLILMNVPVQEKLFLSYPNGEYSSEVMNIAKNLDYNMAFTTVEEKFDENHVKLAVPRFHIFHDKWWKNYIRLKMQVK